MHYAFGPFELDTSTLELKRDGEPISVEPQVFELLVYLIENRDRVLSKDDLIEAVWGGRIVSDAAISSRIRLVRRAVDDDGTRQSVIKTVHGKGFRFIADLSEGNDHTAVLGEPVPVPETQPEDTPRPRLPNRILTPLGLVAAAILGLFLVVQLYPSGGTNAAARIAVLPVANETGDTGMDWAELGLMSLVISALEARSEFPLISAGTVTTLSERFESDESGDLLPSAGLQAALENGHGASHILVSRLTGTADNLTLEYRMLNPRGVSAPSKVSGELAAELAAEMSRQVAASLPRSGERQLDAPVHLFDDAYIAETYARGQDLQLKGFGQESADLFRAAAVQAPENLKIRYELAVSTRMAGDYEAAEALFEAIIREAQDAGDLMVQGAALNGLGVLFMTTRDDAAALESFERALTVLDATDDDIEARALALTNLGIIHRRLRDYDASEEALGRALVEFQAAGYETTPGILLNAMALLRIQLRDVPTANEYLSEALTYHRLTGDRRAEATALHNIGTNSVQIGEYAKGATFLNSALELRTEMADTKGQMSTLSVLAQLEANQGRASNASAHVEAMTAIAEAENDTYHFARAEIMAAHIDFVLGDWTAAEAHSVSAEAAFTSLSRTRNAYREQIRQAVIRGFAGSTTEHANVRRVLEWAIEEDQQGTQLSAYEALTALSLVQRDAEAAAHSIDSAVGLASDMHLNAVAGRLAARQGIIRLMLSDTEGAMASLGRAKANYADHQDTQLLGGLLALASGDTDAGAELIAKSKRTAGDNWAVSERLFQTVLEGI